jgi:hypothetical protein
MSELPTPFGYTATHTKWDSREFDTEIIEVNSEHGWVRVKLYTEAQMRDYGRAVRLATLEDAAKVCEDLYERQFINDSDMALDCAAAIRRT